MKHYIGVKQVKAEPQERDGVEGYRVVYPDDYESWSPKDVFEAAYLELGEDSTRITEDVVNGFMVGGQKTRMGNHMVVFAEFRNGFTTITDSACVDEENYDEQVGTELAAEKAHSKLWELLGFVLAWGRNGLRESRG